MTLNNPFPKQVFPDEIAQNFTQIASEENIPVQYLFSTALYTVGALSGNMFYFKVKGKRRTPIIYSSLVGPSSVGKSPSFDIVCSNIIAPLRHYDQEQLQLDIQDWRNRRNEAKAAKQDFDEPQPRVKIRMIEEATQEALIKYAEFCPAGFGVYYDEGAQLFTGINKYKADSKSDDFWNTNFNGKIFQQIRVDGDRERYVKHPAISIMMGLQPSRLADYFKRESIDSGLFNRFLFTMSDYIQLKTDVDISVPSHHPCEEWASIVKHLYKRGTTFLPDQSIEITLEATAFNALNKYASDLSKFTNGKMSTLEKGSPMELHLSYDGKMYGYIFKFCMILAIMDDPKRPVIRLKHVEGAQALTKYYKKTAHYILNTLFNQAETGMPELCQQLYNELPNQFSAAEAMMACSNLSFTESFFHVNFTRGAFSGFIEKVARGTYQKT